MVALLVILIVSMLISIFFIRNMLKFFFITSTLAFVWGIVLFAIHGFSSGVWISSQNPAYDFLMYLFVILLIFITFFGIEWFFYRHQIELPFWLKTGQKPPSDLLEAMIFLLIVILYWLVYTRFVIITGLTF
ncbi:MAG: hypothetical protein H0Z33_15140 [Bacillaceae bacterium]|nr:hypothetical protein [Bacillaceae bacterium]